MDSQYSRIRPEIGKEQCVIVRENGNIHQMYTKLPSNLSPGFKKTQNAWALEKPGRRRKVRTIENSVAQLKLYPVVDCELNKSNAD